MLICESDNQQQGFILVMALIYLFVLALLLTSAFSSSLLQIKMASLMENSSIAFQHAETALSAGEAAIQGHELNGSGSISTNTAYNFVKLPQTSCGLIFYQVNATGSQAKAKVHLQSVFALPKTPPVNEDECPGEKLIRHRVCWVWL